MTVYGGTEMFFLFFLKHSPSVFNKAYWTRGPSQTLLILSEIDLLQPKIRPLLFVIKYYHYLFVTIILHCKTPKQYVQILTLAPPPIDATLHSSIVLPPLPCLQPLHTQTEASEIEQYFYFDNTGSTRLVQLYI